MSGRRGRISSLMMFRNRQLWAVSIASSIRSIGFGASWPFMAIFFNEELGVPITIVGIMFTILAFISTVYSLVGGILADLLGRRNTILLGAVTGIVIYSIITFAISENLSVILISELFVFSAISGAFVFPSASSVVADVSSSEERNIAYSIYRIMSNLGWAIGPLTGSFIVAFGMKYIFILLIIASVLQFVVVFLFVRDSELKKKEGRHILEIGFDRLLLMFCAGTFFITLLSSQFSVTLPVYSVHSAGITESQLGYIYAVNGTVVVVGQYPMSYILRRIDETYVIIMGALFYAIGYLLVGFSHGLPDLMGDMAIITVGENLTSPGMNTIVSRIAPEGKTGRYMGFLSMVNSTGRAIGPSAGSFFLSLFIYNGVKVWSLLSAMGLLSIMFLFIFSVMQRHSLKGDS